MPYTNIDSPKKYFEAKTYTGTGATQSITGLNFKPDLVWIKDRTVGFDHVLQDAVRGTTKIINSNQNYAEFTNANSITSFNSDGFTTGSYVATNNNTTPFVSWNWLASNTTASNTSGTITSTVSANTTSGFSIVSYTGTGATATIGHGLGVAPKMIIVKQRSAIRDWVVGHSGIGWTKYLYLNSAQASAIGNFFNDTTPSSTVFNVVNDGGVNASGGTYIAYCFAEVKGFSKFGSYVANGSLDNAFVYTGFKPAMVIIKRSDGANSWTIFDNKRDPYNEVITHMAPNNSITDDSDTTYNDLDFLSNGFKIREDNAEVGASGGTYIYMCFAENPFVSSKGIPCTAR